MIVFNKEIFSKLNSDKTIVFYIGKYLFKRPYQNKCLSKFKDKPFSYKERL